MALEDLGRLRSMAARAGRGADPDELVQEFALRVLRQPGRFLALSADEQRAWTFVVMRRLAAELARTAGRAVPVADLPEDAVIVPSALDLLVAREGCRELVAALDGLDRDTRHLVIARALDATPYAVLTGRFGASEPVLRRRYARAVARLRTALGRAVLAVAPTWMLLPRRTRPVRALDPSLVAASSVMVGVLVLTAVAPSGNAPWAIPPAEAAPSVATAVPNRLFPPIPPGPRVPAAQHATQPDRSGPQPSRVGGKLPAPAARACVNRYCVGTGRDETPGDHLFVVLPEPYGRRDVLSQNAAPVCDVVPPSAGPVGCERHP